MDIRIERLLEALDRSSEREPTDLPSALQELPAADLMFSPWETWILIGLVRHRERQAWVEQVIRDRLRGGSGNLAVAGSLGHPASTPRRGPIPGMPEWEYRFHGRGCEFSHKVDGDVIDVDFWGETADYFDTYFYQKFLESPRRPEPPEQRLRQLYSSTDSVTIAVADLLACGVLVPLSDRSAHPYRLAEGVNHLAAEVEAFCEKWSHEPKRLWLAALIGDWPAADSAAVGHPELTTITGPRAAQCRENQWRRLQQELGVPYRNADALRTLADLEAPFLDGCLRSTLQGQPSGLISAALDIIGKQDDSRWGPQVYELFSRINPEGDLPAPHIWMTSLKFLLRHGYRLAEVTAALAKAGRTELGEAVLLALEHAPALALPLIRRGLLDEAPCDRTDVAAILAVFNTPWSRHELYQALDQSDEQERTADVRAAIMESGDEIARQLVLDWEERNPHENGVGSYVEVGGQMLGPFFTFGEHALRDRMSRIRWEMNKFHDRIQKLRGIIPPDLH